MEKWNSAIIEFCNFKAAKMLKPFKPFFLCIEADS